MGWVRRLIPICLVGILGSLSIMNLALHQGPGPQPRVARGPRPKISRDPLALPQPSQKPRPAAARLLDRMRYWSHFGSPDRSWLPIGRPGKYMLISVDHGGFNNIRLAFEIQIVLALLTGRSLVLPQKEKWYLLGSAALGFNDFFDMEALQRIVPCISWETFHSRTLKHRMATESIKLLPLRNAVAWPSMQKVRAQLPQDRLANQVSDRELVDIGPGTRLWDAEVLKVDHDRFRLLGTWHTFVVFAEPRHDREMKRMMRNYVHYEHSVWERAAKAVAFLGGIGSYTALHIRRGDFQYKEVKLGAAKLWQNLKPLIERSGKRTLYISTDESNMEFFSPFRQAGYKLHFWKDMPPKAETPFHLIGMVEQLICVEANLFVGTRLSTFTSYIQRLRGYTPGLHNKEIFYGDRAYTGNAKSDGNEKLIDTTNTRMGGGELSVFREPANVWLIEDKPETKASPNVPAPGGDSALSS